VIFQYSFSYLNDSLTTPTTPSILLNRLPTKVSRRYLEDGEKVRVSKKSGQLLPKPDPLLNRIPRLLGKFSSGLIYALIP
jgi:hypothetical protein